MDEDVFNKRRLRSRVVESQPTSKPFKCYVNCMKNCRCVSYNVCNGGKLCELNWEKKGDNISLYEQREDCDYHEYEFSKQVRRNYCGGGDDGGGSCGNDPNLRTCTLHELPILNSVNLERVVQVGATW